MNRIVVAVSLSLSLAAVAQDSATPTADVSTTVSALADPMANAERLFPQGLSPITNNTRFYSSTAGRAASNAGANSFRISERVDLALINAVTVSVAFEYRSSGQATPEVTAKYQFLRQELVGVNMAAALKYKLVGFNPNGSEMEGILAASRTFGPVVAMVNGVFGRGLNEPDMDAELVLGLGIPFMNHGFAGLNGQAKLLVGEAADELAASGGRTLELLGGAVVAYRFGIVEASLLGGFLSPTGTTPAGPMGLARLGLMF